MCDGRLNGVRKNSENTRSRTWRQTALAAAAVFPHQFLPNPSCFLTGLVDVNTVGPAVLGSAEKDNGQREPAQWDYRGVFGGKEAARQNSFTDLCQVCFISSYYWEISAIHLQVEHICRQLCVSVVNSQSRELFCNNKTDCEMEPDPWFTPDVCERVCSGMAALPEFTIQRRPATHTGCVLDCWSRAGTSEVPQSLKNLPETVCCRRPQQKKNWAPDLSSFGRFLCFCQGEKHYFWLNT